MMCKYGCKIANLTIPYFHFKNSLYNQLERLISNFINLPPDSDNGRYIFNRLGKSFRYGISI